MRRSIPFYIDLKVASADFDCQVSASLLVVGEFANTPPWIV